MSKPQFQYEIPKAQLILLAFVAFVLAACDLWVDLGRNTKRAVFVFAFLTAVGFGFLYTASTIETWCAPTQAVHGGLTWGDHAWHEPTLRDCLTGKH